MFANQIYHDWQLMDYVGVYLLWILSNCFNERVKFSFFSPPHIGLFLRWSWAACRHKTILIIPRGVLSAPFQAKHIKAFAGMSIKYIKKRIWRRRRKIYPVRRCCWSPPKLNHRLSARVSCTTWIIIILLLLLLWSTIS